MSKQELKGKLTDIQYEVTQNCGTEKPFDNAWNTGEKTAIGAKINGKMEMITIDTKPLEKNDTAVEVEKGSLVLLHGKLPHYSCENKSNKSRHAYSLHIIDGNSVYPKENWLQRPSLQLKGFI